MKPISLLNTLAASELLGISPNTLKDWRLRHYGPPPIYLSPDTRRGVRYERTDIEAFIRERKRISNGKGEE
ncbi:MAG: helix-turn-helix transcriptional regulator [Gammaproteobacteria bacterium]